MAAEAEWVSAHLFYQGSLDAVALELVSPVIDELTEAGVHVGRGSAFAVPSTHVGRGSAFAVPSTRGCFFLRHWDGGLHVRLRVHTAEGAEVRARILERAERFFAAHPSKPRMTPEDYLVQAEKLARLEGATDYARALAPNDSVAFVPYRPEHAKYGEGAAMEAVERHFAESSRLALDLLRAAPSPNERDTAAYSFMLLAWFLGEPDLARLLPQVAAAAHPPDPPRGSPALWRAALDKRYRDQRDRLSAIASQLRTLAVRAGELPEAGSLAIWARSATRLRDALEAEGAAGRFPPGDEPGPAAVLRVLDRCAHLVCNRIGISLNDESYLRMLAARTVGHLAGVRV